MRNILASQKQMQIHQMDQEELEKKIKQIDEL
jgi:hypothetical protein